MLEQNVQQFINRHQLLHQNDKILVGVSGGPDSLALLHFLKERKHQWGFTIVAAHVDHMFRGKQSYDELLYVQKLCEEWGIEFIGEQIYVQKIMEEQQTGLQETARKVRYNFFSKVMKEKNLNVLALAHHGDDQIETILMRLTRGSDWKGRAGIPVKRKFGQGFIVRPFLCVTKDEIEDYCKKHSLHPVYDPSNKKLDYSRNRFRQKILPFLKEENKNVHIHFQRYSEELQEDHSYLMELTVQQMNKLMRKKCEKYYEITIEPFLSMPLPLQRRGIHLILNYLYKEIPPSLSAVHIDSILRLLNNPFNPSGMLNLPNGLKVERSYNICSFHFPSNKMIPYNYLWDLTHNIELPDGSILTVNNFKGNNVRGNNVFILDLNKIPLPLYIRTRENGDRIQLKGMNGSKKISDIFIDEKIPKKYRDYWPVITNSHGEIIWIPGLKKSNYEANVDGNIAGTYIILKYEKNQDS
jgi:tRNA(Ile)-lysidine synthase